jgi:hypothetical protein
MIGTSVEAGRAALRCRTALIGLGAPVFRRSDANDFLLRCSRTASQYQ